MSFSSTRSKPPALPAARPDWAIQWSRSHRAKRGVHLTPSSSSPPPSRPSIPSSSIDFLTSSPPERSLSRLSNHLTKEEQDIQALSNDKAQQRALPAHRYSTSYPPNNPLPVPQTPSRGWEDNQDQSWAGSSIQAVDLTIRGPIRIEPSKVHQELLKKESIKPPVFGGRSKNQQLGSVAESWGVDLTIEIPRGMFELDDDPPSPTLNKELTPAELRAERARRAALGIPAEKSGRPSIKEMEREMLTKMKHQQLKAERQKNEIDMSQMRSAIDVVDGTSTKYTQDSSRYTPSRQATLSERLRSRELGEDKESELDGW